MSNEFGNEFGHGPSPSPSVLIQGRREAWVREYLDPYGLLTGEEIQDDEFLRGSLRECGLPEVLPWDLEQASTDGGPA